MNKDNALPLPQSISLEEEVEKKVSHHKHQSVENLVTDVYEKLRPALLNYSYQLIGSTGEAEDIVQIAFIKFYDQLIQRSEIRNVRGWLYKVVHNLTVNHLCRSARKEHLNQEWGAEHIVEIESGSAEENLIQRQQIERALSLLNEKERHCLMLRVEGLSYKETSEVLEISVKSVSVYLTRGLKKFEAKNEND